MIPSDWSQPTGWDGWHGSTGIDRPIGTASTSIPAMTKASRCRRPCRVARRAIPRPCRLRPAPLAACTPGQAGQALHATRDVTTVSGDAQPGRCTRSHGCPVCPRYDVLSDMSSLSLTVLLCGAIRQILVHPSRPTARIYPLQPAIQAIPTFGIYGRCYHGRTGYKPAEPKYPSELNGMDGPDRQDQPDHQDARARGGSMANPMYRQIAEDLREQIESASLEPGQQLRTEIELREHYGARATPSETRSSCSPPWGWSRQGRARAPSWCRKIEPYVTTLTGNPKVPSRYGECRD